jgi:hypothetical protein
VTVPPSLSLRLSQWKNVARPLLNNLRAEPEIRKAKVQTNLSTEAIDVYAEDAKVTRA